MNDITGEIFLCAIAVVKHTKIVLLSSNPLSNAFAQIEFRAVGDVRIGKCSILSLSVPYMKFL